MTGCDLLTHTWTQPFIVKDKSSHVKTVDVLPSPVQVGTDTVLARTTIGLSLLPEA